MAVALFVIGSGRSGTSLCALSLHAAGLALPSDLLAPDHTNPRGFAESAWTIDLHNRQLARSRVKNGDARPHAGELVASAAPRSVTARMARWLDRECSDDVPLVVKDPRTALFLGGWLVAARTVGVTPVFVIMNRDPAEVAASRESAYATHRSDEDLASWINMSLLAERGTRGFPRLVVNHRDVLRDPVRETARMLDLAGVDHAPGGRFDPERALTVVDPSLHRNRAGGERARIGLGALGGRLHEALVDLGASESDPAARRQVDAIARDYRAFPSIETFAFGEPGTLDRLNMLVPSRLRHRIPAGLRHTVRDLGQRGDR